MSLINKEVLKLPPLKVQEEFNKSLISYITKAVKRDWSSISDSNKHKLIMQTAKRCRKCDNCEGLPTLTPRYLQEPSLVVMGRAVTAKDIQSVSILSEEHSTYSTTVKIVNTLGFTMQDVYYTNLTFCGSPKVNSLTESNFSKCFLYKNLEFSTMKLPKVFVLLGNDAFNAFFGKNCSIQSILGTAYLAEYLGEERLFIPVPHPVNLQRNKELYKDTAKVLEFYKEVLEQCRKEVI